MKRCLAQVVARLSDWVRKVAFCLQADLLCCGTFKRAPTRAYIHMHISVCIYAHTRIHLCAYTPTRAYIYMHMRPHAHISICIYAHTRIYLYAYAPTRAYISMHIRLHARRSPAALAPSPRALRPALPSAQRQNRIHSNTFEHGQTRSNTVEGAIRRGPVVLINLTSGEVVARLAGLQTEITALSFDGERVVAGSAQPTPTHAFGRRHLTYAFAFSPGERNIPIRTLQKNKNNKT